MIDVNLLTGILFIALGQTYSTMKDHAKAKIWYLKSIESKQDHIPGLLAYAKHLHATVSTGRCSNLYYLYIYIYSAQVVMQSKNRYHEDSQKRIYSQLRTFSKKFLSYLVTNTELKI